MTEEKRIIETVDENGNNIKFQLFDIIEFEDKEYALLISADANEEDEEEIIIMRLLQEGDEYTFETIEDDEEFERVSEYLENIDEDEDEE